MPRYLWLLKLPFASDNIQYLIYAMFACLLTVGRRRYIPLVHPAGFPTWVQLTFAWTVQLGKWFAQAQMCIGLMCQSLLSIS